MKPKKINYVIEEPCQEDWDQMQPETQGRFCSSCSKTVVDFSTMSDFSIVSYLEKNKHQSVCGRFGEDQLEKTYFLPKQHYSPFSFDLKAVALGLALSTFSALPSQAQNSTAVEQHDSINEPKVTVQGAVARSYDHRSESFVGGKVKLKGKDIENVKISLFSENTEELTSVKLSGDGTFRIPLNWIKDPASIRVTAPGYAPQRIYFENHQSLGDLTITLYEQRMKKGKVAVKR